MPLTPFTPMSPLLTDSLPTGEGWIHQLKWDGFRTIAWVDQGKVELYSKNMLLKNNKYPDLVEALEKLRGTFMLDGEVAILDGSTQRPSFQKMQQRDKLSNSSLIRRAAEQQPVQYILFDLLHLNGNDLRSSSLSERSEALRLLSAGWSAPFFLVDTFENGEALWNWVELNGWEGVVSKRLSSSYHEGKAHRDWVKRKTVFRTEAEAVGILYKEGRVSSLAMRREGSYFGRVSSGLNGKVKAELEQLAMDGTMEQYFSLIPEGLRGTDIRWLRAPLLIEVNGREITEGGTLRHPKLLTIGGKLL